MSLYPQYNFGGTLEITTKIKLGTTTIRICLPKRQISMYLKQKRYFLLIIRTFISQTNHMFLHSGFYIVLLLSEQLCQSPK